MGAISSYPANLSDVHVAVVEAIASTVRKLVLNPRKKYSIAHLGFQDDGTTADTSTVFLASAGDPTASFAADDNKLILMDDWSVVIGPGIQDLRMVASAGGAPMLQIVTSDQILEW